MKKINLVPVRVTAQLINAVTGFHLWSHSYDRDLGDMLSAIVVKPR